MPCCEECRVRFVTLRELQRGRLLCSVCKAQVTRATTWFVPL